VSGLRVAFLGNDAWSVPPLAALARSDHRPVLVITRVPRPAGRGSRLTPTTVADAAGDLGLQLAEVETVKSGAGFDLLAEVRPDALVVVAYGEILPEAVLDLPIVAAVNLHFSLLPALRGPSPVQHALLEGDNATGVTTMVIDRGVDTGPILLQEEVTIQPEDDAGTLGARLAGVGGPLLVRALDGLSTGSLQPQPQDETRATYAPKLGPEDRWLDWREDAEALIRRVRALGPEPATSARFRGDVLKVFRADTGPATDARPGTVASVDGGGFVIGAGRGSVRPLEVAPAGRRRMTAAEFVRGYRPRPGERLD
jgi:methionyl-tRNA formyltransferase